MVQTTTFLEDVARNMEIAGVPGVALAVIKDDQLAVSVAMGVKNLETQAPITEDTIFHAASLSKPVFAYGVLSLQQEGKLDLDRPLDSYLSLPEANERPQLKQITARQVLSHTSGLQNWRLQADDKLQFAFPPGTAFSYSGEGYYYLQLVVEQITRQGVEAFLQDRVLRPLGMTASTFIWRAGYETLGSLGRRDRAQMVEPEIMRFGPKLLEMAARQNKPLGQWMMPVYVAALAQIDPTVTLLPLNFYPNVAYSMLTTANDYARFMLRLLNPHDKIAASMLVPQHTLCPDLFWGLGIGLEKIDEATCFWHWGNMGIFTSFMFGNPAAGSGAVIFTNGLRGLNICDRVLRTINGHDLASFMWL